MLLRRLLRAGFRRGVGGSRGWLAVGVAAGGLRLVRRLARPKPEVLYRAELRPGDAVEISGHERA